MASAKRRRQRANVGKIDEPLAPVAPGHTYPPTLIEESAGTLLAVAHDLVDLGEGVRSDGTISICIATPGWGSFGYYSAECLQEAADAGVYPVGTHMYWDHPTASEKQERPERSLRDLAAVLETAATWRDGNKGPGLYAQAKVFEGYRTLIDEVAPHIGVSLRAGAEVSSGEVDGRRGRIIQRLVEGYSVDFVTKAGRGGAVLSVMEAHRPHAQEAGLYNDDKRDRLRAALIDRFGEGQDRWCYVRDFDDDSVVFELYGDAVENPGTFQIAYRIDSDGNADLDAGEPTEVKVTTTYSPVATPNNLSEEDEMTPEEIKEAVAAAVKAEVTPIQEANTKLEADLAEATTKLGAAEETAKRASEALLVTAAEAHVSANDKVKGLPAVTQARLTESLAKGAAFKDGTTELDVAKLDEAIKTAVDAEVKYLAEATGSPVSGVGGDGPAPTAEQVTEADAALEAAFKRAGLSEASAKVATAGRA